MSEMVFSRHQRSKAPRSAQGLTITAPPDARLRTIELGLIDNVAVFGGKVLSVGATVRDDGGLDLAG